MKQDEFLERLALGRDEFRDLMQKFAEFRDSLNPAQLDAVERSMPTMARAVRSLGGDLTADQLTKIVKRLQPGGVEDGGTFAGSFLKHGRRRLD